MNIGLTQQTYSQNWTQEEQGLLPERLEKCTEIVRSFGTAGVSNTMNQFNGK